MKRFLFSFLILTMVLHARTGLATTTEDNAPVSGERLSKIYANDLICAPMASRAALDCLKENLKKNAFKSQQKSLLKKSALIPYPCFYGEDSAVFQKETFRSKYFFSSLIHAPPLAA